MNRLSLVLAGLVVGLAVSHHAAEAAPPIPTFVDETASAGINSVYAGQWQWMVGGGVATFDCNADGFPDMFLAGGEGQAKFYRNASTRGGPLRFVEEQSGLEMSDVVGAYPLDVDGDGEMDLMVLRVGEDMLMRGLGSCKFTRANEAWGFTGGDSWSTAFSATWEHGAEWPTLAVGTYIDRRQEIDPWGSCTDNWLFRPKATDGQPQRVFDKPLPLKPSYCPLSMLFTDWNRSGTQSLRIANDREYYRGGQEQLWRIESGKPPVLYGAKDGWKPLKIWGMGIASYDLTGDGYPDYFMTSMADSKLQTLSAPADAPMKPEYKDVAFAKGVIAQRPYTGGDVRPSTGWHAQFEDINNDGLADLFIAKGNVSAMPDFAEKDPNNLLLQQPDGKFEEVGDKAGVANFANSRGAAVTDFNLDGLMDIVVVHRWENAQLLRNTSTNAGHWVEFSLEQDGANRNAIGAWVEVRRDGTVMRREITVGGGHAGGQSGWVHFGLGEVAKADVRVTWPDGTAGDWESVHPDNFYVFERGKPARLWSPSR